VLEIPSLPGNATVDELVTGLAERHASSRTAHHGHLPEIRFSDPDHARGIWALNDVVCHPDAAASSHVGYGYYQEEYRREHGEWKIARLRLSYLRDDPLPSRSVPHDDGRPPVSPAWLGDYPGPDATRLDDLEDLHRLKAQYFRCLDGKDWDGLRAL